MANFSRHFSRDSAIWWCGIVAAVVVGLSALQTCDPHVTNCAASPTNFAYYGIPEKFAPLLRLGALIVGIVSGVMKTSPRPHSEYGEAKITPKDSNDAA